MLGTVMEDDPAIRMIQSPPSLGGDEVMALNAPPSPRVEQGNTRSELSEIERLRNAVRSLEIRAETAEKTLQNERRRQSRASMASMGSAEGLLWSCAKPKLAPPWIFLGRYSVLSNVLNWLNTVEKYLDQTRTSPEDWMGYARTYTGPKVQSWFDVTFIDPSPLWEKVREEMINRYLPEDHEIQVEMEFERTTQRRGLSEYVEQFQLVDAALRLANVTISDAKKVRGFAKGLREEKDIKWILNAQPKNLKEVYHQVSVLRQSKTLCHGPSGRPAGTPGRDLRRLTKTGTQSQGCPWCGKTNHYLLKDCTIAKAEW
jgi:hypothetical protein